MSLTDTHRSASHRPRVGIPWRTSADEEHARATGQRGRTEDYIKAVEKAGGEATLVPLRDQGERNRLIPTLDAFVLPGSPADVDPEEYEAKNTGTSNEADEAREKADRAILQLAFAQQKPVLAICYGFQNLNVHLKGSLIQDIRTELGGKATNLERHRRQDPPRSEKDPEHRVALEPGSRLASLAGDTKATVNSSHHQAIARVGKNLRITARAIDGIIEGLEWTGDSNWVTGVQWHPERMSGDAFSERLFSEFVAAAVKARETMAHKT